jgi:hypothetical protein
VPFLRISRDKRGYEYFALVHVTSGRRGKVRQRILYWFRTPPNVRIGRPPFDEEIMRALEAQYPDVTFDWEALKNTPMPAPSVEHWRERRRADRAARQFRAEDEQRESLEEAQVAAQTAAEPNAEGSAESASTTVVGAAASSADGAGPPTAQDGLVDLRRRRHGRRGGRGRDGRPQSSGGFTVGPTRGGAATSIERNPEQPVDGGEESSEEGDD